MAYCKNCGANIPDNATFCSSCGTPVHDAPAPQQYQNSYQPPVYSDEEDIKKNKPMAVLAYLGILVLIPFFGAKDSKFARFHTKQGALNFLATIAYSFCTMIINLIVGGIFQPTYGILFVTPHPVASLVSTVLNLGSLVFLAFAILGIVNVVQGKCKELPFLGKINIFDNFLGEN